MSMFHVYQLPVPLITSHDRSYFAVVEHSGKLICTAKKFDDLARSARLNPPNHGAGVTDPDERAKLRAELDAMVAHFYRLTEDEFAHILMTFPIVPEETKQAALDEFVRMRESGEAAPWRIGSSW